MSPIIEGVAPRLLGPALMLAAAVIVKGYNDVGDGFSAAVIVALAVGLRYIALGPERAEAGLPLLRRAPQIAGLGLLVTLATGFAGIAAGEPPFTFFPRAGEEVIRIGTLELISAVAFDIGLFLLVASVFVILIHHLSLLERGREP